MPLEINFKGNKETGAADNDNKELMAFLEKKFDGIEKQFEGIYERLDNTASKDDLAAATEKGLAFAS